MTNLFLLASFTSPTNICTNPAEMLWILPLAASIAITYKATKLPTITLTKFLKESAILFGSIVIFITITALILLTAAWLINI